MERGSKEPPELRWIFFLNDIYIYIDTFFFTPLKYKLEHPNLKKEEEEHEDDNIERFTMQD